jgi:hypothetical protein
MTKSSLVFFLRDSWQGINSISQDEFVCLRHCDWNICQCTTTVRDTAGPARWHCVFVLCSSQSDPDDLDNLLVLFAFSSSRCFGISTIIISTIFALKEQNQQAIVYHQYHV